MLNKVFLFYLVLIVSAATPWTPHSRLVPRGSSIRFRPRTPLTDSVGVFDKEKAIVATILTKNKHRHNLINLKMNKGLEAFNLGAVIKPVVDLPLDILEKFLKGLLFKRQALPLTDINELEWAGPISIGTPAKQFLIDFDTGSSDLWYNASSSSTSSKRPGTFAIAYGDGSTVSGPIYTDIVNVAGVKVVNQSFSAVTALSSNFAVDPIDGILGLAFPALSSMGQIPFFTTAHNSGAVKSNSFSLLLSTNGSELFFGGTNKCRHLPTIEYHSVNKSSAFWQIAGAKAKIGSTAVVSGFQTIIDSGTTIIYGPPAAVKTFYSKIPGSALFDNTNGFYSYPCASAPQVSFNWGGADWSITAANFNLGKTKIGSTECVGALAGDDMGLGSNVWLLGDSFMKNVYTTFDADRPAVGFAALKL